MRISKDLNNLYDSEYNSKKLLLPEDVLDQFKEFYFRFRGNNPNLNQNIQREEIPEMDRHFKNLKNSNYSFESSFYNDIAEVIGQINFVIKGYLTWSLNHQYEYPATIQMFPFRGDMALPPMRICFLSVDQSNDCYLQVWKKVHLYLILCKILNLFVFLIDT